MVVVVQALTLHCRAQGIHAEDRYHSTSAGGALKFAKWVPAQLSCYLGYPGGRQQCRLTQPDTSVSRGSKYPLSCMSWEPETCAQSKAYAVHAKRTPRRTPKPGTAKATQFRLSRSSYFHTLIKSEGSKHAYRRGSKYQVLKWKPRVLMNSQNR